MRPAVSHDRHGYPRSKRSAQVTAVEQLVPEWSGAPASMHRRVRHHDDARLTSMEPTMTLITSDDLAQPRCSRGSSPSCPDPIARARHRTRRARDQPVADAGVPARRAARRRLHHRRRRRQPLPRLQRRHRGHGRRPRPSRRSTPRSTPRSTTSCTTARATSTYPSTPRSASGWPPASPMRPAQGVPGQLGHGGRRRRDQAGSPLHRAAERDRVLRRLPRSLARQPVAHRVEGQATAAGSAA